MKKPYTLVVDGKLIGFFHSSINARNEIRERKFTGYIQIYREEAGNSILVEGYRAEPRDLKP